MATRGRLPTLRRNVRSAFGKQIETHAAASAAPLARGESEELRGASAALAAPLVGRLDQIARLKRAPEARLVEASTQEELVDPLEVAERERGWEQAKGEGRLVEALSDHG